MRGRGELSLLVHDVGLPRRAQVGVIAGPVGETAGGLSGQLWNPWSGPRPPRRCSRRPAWPARRPPAPSEALTRSSAAGSGATRARGSPPAVVTCTSSGIYEARARDRYPRRRPDLGIRDTPNPDQTNNRHAKVSRERRFDSEQQRRSSTSVGRAAANRRRLGQQAAPAIALSAERARGAPASPLLSWTSGRSPPSGVGRCCSRIGKR
jgi:hypothetical protein